MTTKEKITRIVQLSLEKEMTLYINSKVKMINVYKIIGDEVIFDFSSYYDGRLKNTESSITNTVNVDSLIKKIENYV